MSMKGRVTLSRERGGPTDLPLSFPAAARPSQVPRRATPHSMQILYRGDTLQRADS